MTYYTKEHGGTNPPVTRSLNYIAKLYPSGHFSVSLKKQSFKAFDRNKYTNWGKESQALEHPDQKDGDRDVFDNSLKTISPSNIPQESPTQSTSTELVQTAPPSLAYSAKLSQNERKPHGVKGLAKRAKKVIESACCCLENKYGKNRLGFGTLTLPELSDGRMAWLSQEIGVLVKRFFEWYKRECERIGSPTEVIYVIELHPQRSMRQRQYIPHIHFVYVCRNAQQAIKWRERKFYITADKFRKAWRRIIINSLARYKEKYKDYSLVCWKQGMEVDTQVIRKSAAGYLAKYMSKGGKFLIKLQEKVIKKTENGIEFALPKQWWGYSKGMKKCVDESITELPIWLRDLALRLLEGYKPHPLIYYLYRPKYFCQYTLKERAAATCGKILRSKAMEICFGKGEDFE